jgi:GPH family glycoside/pentoside/hexuronide:cation symporter
MKEPTESNPPDDVSGASDPQKPKGVQEGDASRKEVVYYALGNAEAAISDNFPNLLQSVLIVAMQVSPLLMGLIMGIKTIWDSVTDPIMAHITDNTRTRWGRRRPFILVGGVGRVLFLAALVAFMPSGSHLASNALMEAQKFANEGAAAAVKAHETAVKAHEQLGTAKDELRRMIRERVADLPETSRAAAASIASSLPTLREDASNRLAVLANRRAEWEALRTQAVAGSDAAVKLRDAQGLMEAATERSKKADELIAKAVEGSRKAIAAEQVALYLLQAAESDTAGRAQEAANAAFAEAHLEALDIFALERPPPPKKPAPTGALTKIRDGVDAFRDPRNADQRTLILYVLVGLLIYTVFTTVFSVPYYALGIELSPSYNGRTQVVTYRAILSKIAGLLAPWVPVACFSLWFANALDGLFWVSVAACVFGIPCTVLMVMNTRERTHVSANKRKHKGNLFRSMWEIGKNPDFLRIFGLYTFIGLVNGLFQQVGFFLNVYWVMGSALSGAKLGAWVSMVAWGLGFVSLPIINWACRRFEKHRVLGFAVIWMAIGTALKWWAMNPEHPEFQFVLPFFFSVGIGAVYTVLPTMMADVTDVDELRHGLRREGMFGAVMAFLMKMIGALVPILAGAVLVIAGFDPTLEYHQEPSTILNMRLMYSFIPAGMLLIALVMLRKYPLGRQRVQAIKEELKRRYETEEASAG